MECIVTKLQNKHYIKAVIKKRYLYFNHFVIKLIRITITFPRSCYINWKTFSEGCKRFNINVFILFSYPIFLNPIYKILLIWIFTIMNNKRLKSNCGLRFNLKLQEKRFTQNQWVSITKKQILITISVELTQSLNIKPKIPAVISKSSNTDKNMAY